MWHSCIFINCRKFSPPSLNGSLGNGNNNVDSPADVPMTVAAVIETPPVKKVLAMEASKPILPPSDMLPPPLYSSPKAAPRSAAAKSVHKKKGDAHHDSLEDLEPEQNLIVVNNRHVFLADKLIDANANEDIGDARPIVPEFIVSSSSSSSSSNVGGESDDGEATSATGETVVAVSSSADRACLSGDEGLGDISSSQVMVTVFHQ